MEHKFYPGPGEKPEPEKKDINKEEEINRVPNFDWGEEEDGPYDGIVPPSNKGKVDNDIYGEED